MQRLIIWFTRNSIAANLLMLAILVFGALSISQINKEFFPAPDLNTVRIDASYPGAAPINVEQQVCIKIEQAIDGLKGIKRITTKAKNSKCQIDVESLNNYDIKTLLNDVKNRVDAISTLPEDIEKPQVYEIVPAVEMAQLALSSDIGEIALKRYAQEIQAELEALPHISSVEIEGSRAYEISIEVEQQKLQQLNLSFAEVQQAITQSSQDAPLGKLETSQGDLLLQVRSQAKDTYTLGNIVIRSNNEGTIYLRDIATITDGFVEGKNISRYNEKPSLFLQVLVNNNPDVIKTHDVLTGYLATKNQELPESISLTLWYSFYDSFIDRVNTLITNGASGLLLVFIVLMLFLRPLLAIWVCLGIGVSFLGTLWFMPFFGASLNMISLFAFLMILGIVVDDAIIVAESIYEEQKTKGVGFASTKKGTLKVYKPVLYAVISTMLVFFPMMFLPGSSAKAAQAIPLVVLLTLFFSLVESILILPSHLNDMPPEGHFNNIFSRQIDKARGFFSNVMEGFIDSIYTPTLKLSLKYNYAALAAFLVMLTFSISILAGGWLHFSFLPNVDTDHIRVKIQLPEGEPEEKITELSLRLEQASKAVQDSLFFEGTDVSYISSIYVRSYSKTIFAAIELNREYPQVVTSKAITELWNEKIGKIPEANEILFSYSINEIGKPVQYNLAAKSNEELKQASTLLKEYLSNLEGIYNISDSQQTPRSEAELSLSPAGVLNGWNASQIIKQVRSAFYGQEIDRIARDNEDIRIMLRLSKADRKEIDSLYAFPIRQGTQEQTSRLDAITDITYKPSLQEINRIDRKRTITVSADLLEGYDTSPITKQVMVDFKAQLQNKLPHVAIYVEGQEQEREEFMSAWILFFLQAIVAIYAMMAVSFRSYSQPAIILTAIPFGLMGAIFGHLIMGKSINIFSFLGVMACAGVVVNDNLVLIDRINQLKKKGMQTSTIVIQACRDRFRPILLTSITTFIGLLPIMSETSLQAQFLIPMVISLAFGVLFATTVTLILVPTLYYTGSQLRIQLKRLFSR